MLGQEMQNIVLLYTFRELSQAFFQTSCALSLIEIAKVSLMRASSSPFFI
jgi:hypothetical protein